MGLSLALELSGRRRASAFVGQWPAPLLIAGIYNKLVKTLGAAGLEVVNPVDAPFDPALHEALATAPAESAEQDDTVAQVYQPGYVFGGQLLRPARVVVRQWNG